MFKNLILLSITLLSLVSTAAPNAYAYEHEVWKSGERYYWKTFGVERSSSTDLAVAIEGAMGTSGNRDIHILNSGTLYSTINISKPGVRIYGHGNTLTCNFSGTGISNNGYDGFEIHNLTLRNVVSGYGIRSSAASNLKFTNLNLMNIGWIGIRIDSKSRNPWDHTAYNLYMKDIYVDNTGGHGIETYSIDGVNFDGTMKVRNTGGCGVLLNQSHNGTIETVDAYNCDWGGGYAGLRFANGCTNLTAERLYADHCGRGFFIVKSGPTVNCHLNYAEIGESSDIGIWIERGTNCSVKSGCSESGVSVSGAGSYANVNNTCSSGIENGTYVQLKNRATGLFLDGMGRTANGDPVGQWPNTTHFNSQWEVVDAGSGYSQLRNRGTGLFLDGMGLTTNGATIAQYANTAHFNAQWALAKYSGDYYRIQNRATGLFLDGMGRTANGDPVGQWANTTSPNAQWEVIYVDAANRVADQQTLSETAAITYYPNPVKNELNIKLAEHKGSATTATILTMAGDVVSVTSLNDVNNTIDVQTLIPGMYFIQVSNHLGIRTTKFIKK
ncbi:RICIN domain-containing protein [Aquimarina brevivitae]|uniref:Putative secreted protein (Por secretion system target) n=1 Tax=Aquimarina brevivitae TaxID=323412 RepID=A0A4Q7P0Q5_9FLAO|nr:RICIN domain-containing protein [Aquimarina brevivitae]RZS93244.1 putative secreted protein (Por secretion system target) [Aquimarina brevivitae]